MAKLRVGSIPSSESTPDGLIFALMHGLSWEHLSKPIFFMYFCIKSSIGT